MTKLNKLLIALALLFSSDLTVAGDTVRYPVVIKGKNISISSNKIMHLLGEIMPTLYMRQALMEARDTEHVSGDRVVIIDSPGGSVMLEEQILKALLEEKKATHGKLICVVRGSAHSMAFNILTMCDKRYATAGSRMLVHKIRIMFPPGEMFTAKQLSRIVKDLIKDDEPYRQRNSKEMRLSLKEYDDAADAEKFWTAEELLARNYLDGIVTIE